MQPSEGVPVSPRTGVPGWLTDNEETYLATLARQVPEEGIIVEIGTEFGRSCSVFGLCSPVSVKVYGIDLFPTNHPLVGDLLAAAKENITHAPVRGTVLLMRGDSYKTGLNWQNGPIDLLFVDGDHSYGGIMRDITVWFPHLKIGGIVAFHDCLSGQYETSHPSHAEVHRAVEESCVNASWEEWMQVDTLRVFKRLA